MKRYLLGALVVAALVGLSVGVAVGQDKGERHRPGGQGGPGGPGGPGRGNWQAPSPEQILERMKTELALTPEQITQIQKMLDDQKPLVEAWEKENGQKITDLRAKVKEATEKQDKEGAQAAQGELRTLMQSRMELGKGLMTKIDTVLTEEQRAKAKTLLAERMRRPGGMDPMRAIYSLNLTEEQKAKMQEILKAARPEGAGERPSPEAMKAAMDKIKAEVLTEEQRTKLADIEKQAQAGRQRRGGIVEAVKSLNLTEEQNKQMQSILEDARKRAEGVEDPKAREEIMREAGKKVTDEVLTDEQRQQLRQSHQRSGDGQGRTNRGGTGTASGKAAE